MEALYLRGIRYPSSYTGAECDLRDKFLGSYQSLNMVTGLRKNPNRLVFGVTGGIGTGKSTVAGMLEKLGAPIIDFDVLSRIVVESGKPAHQDIVSFFGEQVLEEDKTLNRKRLREIVFQDMEKRKKLESFIHPKIGEELFRQVESYTPEKGGVIIQVVVPLLFEPICSLCWTIC